MRIYNLEKITSDFIFSKHIINIGVLWARQCVNSVYGNKLKLDKTIVTLYETNSFTTLSSICNIQYTVPYELLQYISLQYIQYYNIA